MTRGQTNSGARLLLRIAGLFSQAERLFLAGPSGILLGQSSLTLDAPPHCTPFPGGPHPSMCASAASASGSQKVMSMAW
jgi:hypothetical protein